MGSNQRFVGLTLGIAAATAVTLVAQSFSPTPSPSGWATPYPSPSGWPTPDPSGWPAPSPSGTPWGVSDATRCFARQELIAAAVRNYNLENNTMLTALDMGVWDALIRQGWLGRVLDDPGFGPNSFSNYMLTWNSATGISCMVHGPGDSPAPSGQPTPAPSWYPPIPSPSGFSPTPAPSAPGTGVLGQ